MKIYATLHNSGGEIGREEVKWHEGDDSAELSEAIQDAISGWMLDIGDTIKIIEA